jgi:hypothetical protein
VINRYVGNLPPMPGVFPDYPAPVICNTDAGTELVTMRWGMPPPMRAGGAAITNIRNRSSPHWRMWLKPESRCLVPANSFAEYAPEPNPETSKKDVVSGLPPIMDDEGQPITQNLSLQLLSHASHPRQQQINNRRDTMNAKLS